LLIEIDLILVISKISKIGMTELLTEAAIIDIISEKYMFLREKYIKKYLH